MEEFIGGAIFNLFTGGLIAGLVIAFFVWKGSLMRHKILKSELQKAQEEIGDLSNHINRHMKLTAKGNEELDKEVKDLREQNLNLKDTLAYYKEKSNRDEKRALQVYDRAVHILYEKSPGFAPAWEIAMKEAEKDMDEVDNGLSRIVKKIIRPSLASPTDREIIEEDTPMFRVADKHTTSKKEQSVQDIETVESSSSKESQ